MIPVPDLALFLAGPWRITRRIADRRLGVTGRLAGVGHFAPAPGGLRYVERGLLEFGAFRGTASRALRFALDGAGVADVRFEDGGLFHCLDLSSGLAEVAHDCAPDLYRGRYRVSNPDSWALTWLVAGPRKCVCIASRYVRTIPRANCNII